MNSVKQGDVGVAMAISHYVKLGYIVSIPFTVSSKYDLIIDTGSELRRVQVKTSTFEIKPGIHRVTLCTNTRPSGVNAKILISSLTCDELFVYVINGDSYVIPSTLIDGMVSINLGTKYEQYRVVMA